MTKAKLILVVLLAITAFIGICNTATIWNGVLVVLLIGPWAWATNWWFDWARR